MVSSIRQLVAQKLKTAIESCGQQSVDLARLTWCVRAGRKRDVCVVRLPYQNLVQAGFLSSSGRKANHKEWARRVCLHAPNPHQPRHNADIQSISMHLWPITNLSPSDKHLEVTLDTPFYIKNVLQMILSQDDCYGQTGCVHDFQLDKNGCIVESKKENILVEYSSPNIAKPFHAGHLRSTVIGQFIANLCSALGHNVTRMNYLGDWGTQFGYLGVGFQKFGSEVKLSANPMEHMLEVYVKANKLAEEDKTVHDEAKSFFTRMERGDPQSLAFWEKCKALSLTEYQATYKRLGVTFDVYESESMYQDQCYILLQNLKKWGYLETDPDTGKQYVDVTAEIETAQKKLACPQENKPDASSSHPNASQHHTVEPNMAQPNMTQPHTGLPNTAQANTAEPNTTQHNMAQPSTTQPNTAQPNMAELSGRSTEGTLSELESVKGNLFTPQYSPLPQHATFPHKHNQQNASITQSYSRSGPDATPFPSHPASDLPLTQFDLETHSVQHQQDQQSSPSRSESRLPPHLTTSASFYKISGQTVHGATDCDKTNHVQTPNQPDWPEVAPQPTPQLTCDSPRQYLAVLLKSDGATLYLTRELATAKNRWEKYKPDRMLYVVENGQGQHFTLMTAVLARLGHPSAPVVLVGGDDVKLQGVSHIRFGRISGLSTRKGQVVLLKDILDEARDTMKETMLATSTTKIPKNDPDFEATADVLGISGIIVQDLREKRLKHYAFSWNKMLSFSGDSGIRLQYTHARLCSLITKANHDPESIKEDESLQWHLLKEVEAVQLVQCLAQYEDCLHTCFTDMEACHLISYLTRLSHATSKALKHLNVTNEEENVAKVRLLLFYCAKITLASGLKILGLLPLERM